MYILFITKTDWTKLAMEKAEIISYIGGCILAFIANYFVIRDIIFSFLAADVNIKNFKKKTLKKLSIKERISMSYVKSYVQTYKKQLTFYLLFKKLYIVIWLVFLLLPFVLPYFGVSTVISSRITNISFGIQFVILLLLRLEYGLGGKSTRYEKAKKK